MRRSQKLDNLPLWMAKSFSLIQGSFLLQLLLPWLLGAAACWEDPAQATDAQHQVVAVVTNPLLWKITIFLQGLDEGKSWAHFSAS